MVVDWHLSIYSLSGGVILLGAAYFFWMFEKTVFAPATAMLVTWGVALVCLSFLPVLGFYYVSYKAVLLYVLGAVWFALVTLVTSMLLNQYYPNINSIKTGRALSCMRYSHLFWLCLLIIVAFFPLAVLEILRYGSNITEISYNIRRSSVAGEPILDSFLDNIFVLMGILLSVILFGVVQGKLKLINFILISIPYILLLLVTSGRSGLISLILGWLVIISIFSKRVKVINIFLPVLFLLIVIFLGGIWVGKFDVEDHSTLDTLSILLEHMFSYLYQGPVLFSRFFDGELNISTNWDFLDSACHLLSKLELCVPNPKHADFALYGDLKFGNVYTIYFSIIPIYGILGLVLVFSLYAIFLACLFHGFKRKSLFCLVVYPYMFSAIILSVFKDSVGYSLYWQIKVLVICYLIKVFFTKKTNLKIKRNISYL